LSRIVVGIDGSPAADAALAHALDEARLRNLPLRVVCAWAVPAIEYAGAPFAATPDLNIEAEHTADAVLEQAVKTIGPAPGVLVETSAVSGHPVNVLLEEAKHASLLVVGSRGRNALASIVLGSVSQGVAHHCPTPLMIVPAPRTDGPTTTSAEQP
jgi:nucleotide-binding universal stress UspA family protein